MNGESLIIMVPAALALSVMVYFLYHIKHTAKYSDKILEKVRIEVEHLEENGTVSSPKTASQVKTFKKLMQNRKKLHVFDFERAMGIDMVSFEKKLGKELKKKHLMQKHR